MEHGPFGRVRQEKVPDFPGLSKESRRRPTLGFCGSSFNCPTPWYTPKSGAQAFEDQGGIVPAEAKRVGHSDVDIGFARRIRHIVQVTVGIGGFRS